MLCWPREWSPWYRRSMPNGPRSNRNLQARLPDWRLPLSEEPIPAAFISYSREDSEFALRLAEDLKAAGASVWLDQLDIEPGRPWDSAVEQALIDAPKMLLVLSPSSAKS